MGTTATKSSYWKHAFSCARRDVKSSIVREYFVGGVVVIITGALGLLWPFGLTRQEIIADVGHGLLGLLMGFLLVIIYFIFIRTPPRIHAELEAKIATLRRRIILSESLFLDSEVGHSLPVMSGNRVLEHIERNSDDPNLSKQQIESMLAREANLGRVTVKAFPQDGDLPVQVPSEMFSDNTFNLVPRRPFWKRKFGENRDESNIGGRICPRDDAARSLYDIPTFSRRHIESIWPVLVGPNRTRRRLALKPCPCWSMEATETHVSNWHFTTFGPGTITNVLLRIRDAIGDESIGAWRRYPKGGKMVAVVEANLADLFPIAIALVAPPGGDMTSRESAEELRSAMKFCKREVEDFWPV